MSEQMYNDEQTAASFEEALSPTSSDVDLYRRLNDQWQEARLWWAPVRAKARKARDYYHMLQWTETQKDTLEALGRPAIVINLLGKAVDNVCGRERGSRYDWKASPVGQDDVLAAAAMTHGLKSIARVTNASYAFSDAFEDAVIGPMGWVEIGWDDSDPEQPPEVCERVDPEEMYIDPHSRHIELRDAKYLIRRRIVDVDDAVALAPEHEEAIRAAALSDLDDEDDRPIKADYNSRDDGDQHFGSVTPGEQQRKGRRRIELREHHYWEREHVEFIEMPDGTRYYEDELVAPDGQPDEMAVGDLLSGGGQIADGFRRCFYKAIVGAGKVLHHSKSDLPFGRFPYVAVWAKRDREGRPYGLVELAIPPQEEVNVARARLNEALRSRWVIYRRGALGSAMTAQQVADQLSKANFVLEVESPESFQVGNDKADIQAWLELMREAKQEIDEVFGNNEAAYGDKSNEKSGVAIQMKIQQQATNLGRLFDLLRYSRKQAGQMFLALLQKRTSPEKLTRIIGASLLTNVPPTRLGPDGQPIPGPQPDLSWLDSVVAGPVYQAKFDVEIEDQAETGTQRQQEMQSRIDLMGLVPDDLKAVLLPDTLRASDWSGAEEMAGKVEAQMQMVQDQQQMQQQAEMEQQQAQMQQQAGMHQEKLAAQQQMAQMKMPPPQPQEPQTPSPLADAGGFF